MAIDFDMAAKNYNFATDFDMVVADYNFAIDFVAATADTVIKASSDIVVVTDWFVAVADFETEVPADTTMAVIVDWIAVVAIIAVIVVTIITYKLVAIGIVDFEWIAVIRNSKLTIAADIAIANEITAFLFFNIKLIKFNFWNL